MGNGLRMICKIYGGITFKGADGKVDRWVWDYARDEPRLASEMKAEEKAASERRKWARVKAATEAKKQGDLF